MPQIQTLEYILFQVTERARNDLFKPARTIVNNVMAKCAPELSAAPEGSRPNPDCLKKTTNRKKEQLWPKEPTGLDFTVDDTYLPNDFLKSDMQVGKARHLVFATTAQLEQLARARTQTLYATVLNTCFSGQRR